MPQFARPAAIVLVSVASFSVLFLTLAIVMPSWPCAVCLKSPLPGGPPP